MIITAASTRLQRWKNNIFQVAVVVLLRLTEPSARVDSKQHRRIRLLATFLLLLALGTLVIAMVLKKTGGNAWMVMLVTSMTLIFSYLISRTRYYRAALILAITIPAIPPLAITIFKPPEINLTAALMWLALPLIVSILMVTIKQIISVGFSYIVFVILLKLFSLIEFEDMALVTGYILITTFIVIAISIIRRKDQTEIENQLNERQRTGKTLRESEEKYRNLFEYAKDAIILANAETGILVDVNPAGCRLTGLPKEKIVGMHQSGLHPPELAERYKQVFREHVEKGIVITDDILVQRADGPQVQCDISASVFKLGDKQIIQGVFRDVTERKQMEKAIQIEKNKLQSVIDAMADYLTIQDKDYNIVFQNEPSRISSGGDHVGEKCYRVYENIEKVCEGCPVALAFQDGKPHTTERRQVTPSGEINFLEVTANPIRDDRGKVVTCLEIARNITARKQQEQALNDELTRRRILFDQSKDGIVVIDIDAKVYEANQHFAEMLGYSPEEVRELHTWDWDKNYPREQLLEMGRNVDETGLHIETQQHRKDGSVIDVDISVNGAVIAGQKLNFCVCRDITERKNAEKALRESEEKFSKAFNASPDAISISRMRDGTFLDVNDSYTRITGYNRKELIGKNADEFNMWANGEQRRNAIQKISSHIRIQNEEFQYRDKSGKIHTMLSSTEYVNIGEEPCLLTVSSDITERKKVEEALKESEEKFSVAFRYSPEMIAIANIRTERYIEVNDSYLNTTGYRREEIVNNYVNDVNMFVEPKDSEKMAQLINEQGKMRNQEYSFRMKSGETRRWLCSAETITISGDPCIISVATDITERKKIEEALRESEEKFSRAFRSSPTAVAITTCKEGKFIEVNDSFADTMGYTLKELIGRTATEMNIWVKPQDRTRMFQILKDQGRVNNEEIGFRRKSGNIGTWLFSAEQINIADEPCLIGVSVDITKRKEIEEALRESEEKFSTAFHAIPETISILTLKEGKFIDVNESFLKLNRLNREKVIGHTTKEVNMLTPGDGRNKIQELLKEHDYFTNEEIEFKAKSGKMLTFLFSANTINIGGEPCRLIIGNDITERRRAEQALRDSEEKFSKAFQAIPEAISITRLKDEIFVDVNDSFCRANGHTIDEVIGHTAEELGLWVKSEEHEQMTDIIDKRGRIENEEYEFQVKSGEIRTVLVSAEIIDVGGEPCVLTIGNDITERKRMEKTIRESEEKFFKAFNASPDCTAIVRIRDNVFVDVNENFIKFNGFPREEVIGHTASELNIWVNTEERDRILKIMQEKGSVRNEEFQMRTKSGKIRIGLFSAEVVNIRGEPHSIAMTVDITEQKEAEAKLKEAMAELKQSSARLADTNKELEAFSYSVSHDLRSPLRSIDGFSQALLEDYENKLDVTGQDYLTRLRSASQKMGELIDGILKLSRLTRSEMHRETIDLGALAVEIANRLKETQPRRKVEFIIDKDLTVNGDPQLMRVLLENLLGNAWKFTSKKPRSKIEFSVDRNNGKKAYFIRDNGAGFDMTYADKLFGAFQRLHEAKDFPGTGIGLATVQRIIHRHGGTIWAEGDVGKGATFHFTLD